MRALLVVLLLTPALAGCFGGSGDRVPHSSSDDDAQAWYPDALAYRCPPGDSEEVRDGLCIGTISSPVRALGEPFVALNPHDPAVLAVGANAASTVNMPGSVDSLAGTDRTSIVVFFTEDGAASWRSVDLPYVDVPNPGDPVDGIRDGGDPSMAFDDVGTLHVTGTVSHQGTDANEFPQFVVFYTSTDDLGETWSTPVLLATDGFNDRPWLSVGPNGSVYVSWLYGQTFSTVDSSRIAWSDDRGRHWRTVESKECVGPSPLVFPSTGTPIFSCVTHDREAEDSWDEETGYDWASLYPSVQVRRLDPSTSTIPLVAELESFAGSVLPRLVLLRDASMVLTADLLGNRTSQSDVLMSRSVDGGTEWESRVDVRQLLTEEDHWDWASPMWTAADPWGGMHVIIGGSPGSSAVWDPTIPLGTALDDFEAVHLALDPGTWQPRSVQELIPAQASERLRTPPPVAPWAKDDYHGIAFSDDLGFMVWARNSGLDYTILEPVREPHENMAAEEPSS